MISRSANNFKRHTLIILILIFFSISITDNSINAKGSKDKNPLGLDKYELKCVKKIAREWITLGRWCSKNKMKDNAKVCAKHAEEIYLHVLGLESLKSKAEECENSPDEDAEKNWKRKYKSTVRKSVSYFKKIFSKLKNPDSKMQERFNNYQFKLLELSPNKENWKAVLTLAKKLASSKDSKGKVDEKKVEQAVKLAQKALALKPPKELLLQFKYFLDIRCINKLVLMTATTHKIKYYFSLPKNFKRKKDKKWPVLICIDGAASNFKGIGSGYLKSRDESPYMVVSPCTFSNTNTIRGKMLEKYQKYYKDDVINDANRTNMRRWEWDEKGVLAIIKDLKEKFDAEKRVYVTGCSGGGNVTYMMIFKHPDLCQAAAPACANYARRGYVRLKGKFTAEDINFPIHIFTGEKDQYKAAIEGQTDNAVITLKTIGYPNFKRTMVPGMKHSQARKQVIAAFKPYMLGKKKRSDKLE